MEEVTEILGRINAGDKMAADELLNIIYQLIGGLRSSMGYTGCANIDEMRTKPEFVKVTNAGMRESHVHDVTIVKEAPNYRSD